MNHRTLNPGIFRALATLFALTLIVGCANLERNAYIAIGTSSVGVEAARAAFIDYANTGRVRQQDFDKVKAEYEKYQAAMATAQQMIAAYKANPVPDQTALNNALRPASEAGQALIALIQSLLDAPANAKLKPKL